MGRAVRHRARVEQSDSSSCALTPNGCIQAAPPVSSTGHVRTVHSTLFVAGSASLPGCDRAGLEPAAALQRRARPGRGGGEGARRRAAPVDARWGLIPAWSRTPDIAYRLINARAETAANAAVAPVHVRMPAILPPESFDAWLGGRAISLSPCPAQGIVVQAVSTWVNKPTNDDPRCIEALGEQPWLTGQVR